MSIQLTERIVVKQNFQSYEQLDDLCFRSKNLYNTALFRNRQIYFDNQKNNKKTKLESYQVQASLLKSHNDYLALPAKVSQQVLKLVDKAWKSYFQALSVWVKNPNAFKACPRCPNYLGKSELCRKDGRQVLTYTIQALSKKGLANGLIQLSGSTFECKSKVCKKANKYPKKYQINCVRIVPKLNYYVVEVVYTRNTVKHRPNPNRVASIDLGVNILAALAFNFKLNPMLFSGKPLKSINRYYNKIIASAKSKLSGTGSSKQIRNLWRRREAKITHYLHCVSRTIIDTLLSNKVGLLVIGHNNGQKQKLNIGSVNNQKFTMIPFTTFINQLQYKCELHGIECKLVEESYTSKASSIDLDNLPVHGDMGPRPIYAGKRIKRGLYRTKDGILINADVNGALNIMRKHIQVTRQVIQRVLAFVVRPVSVCVPC